MGFTATIALRCGTALLACMVAVCSSCSTANVGTARGVSATQNYVGRLAIRSTADAKPQTALVAFITAPKDDGTLDVRAYMCDGVEDGDLLWVRGPALPAEKQPAAAAGGSFEFDLTAASGFQVTGQVSPAGISGTITRKSASVVGSEPAEFFAARSAEGNGIFDLTVDDAGNISGASLTGDSMTLSKTTDATIAVGDGTALAGVLETADGTRFEIAQVDLSSLNESELQAEGFDTALAAGEKGLLPGTFRAIVMLDGGGFTTFGRILLPGTGVNNVPPKFGSRRVAFSSRFVGGRP